MPYPQNTISSTRCRIQEEPEIKYFDSGSVKCKLRVSEYQGKSKQTGKGEYLNLDLEIWGKTAEFFINENPHEKDDITFTGSLVDGSYTKNDGTKVYKNIVNVQRIQLLRTQNNQQQSAPDF